MGIVHLFFHVANMGSAKKRGFLNQKLNARGKQFIRQKER